MAITVRKIEDIDDLIFYLTDLTELCDAADDALREIGFEGLDQDEARRLDKGLALVRIATAMSVMIMEGAESVGRYHKAARRKGGAE